MSPLLRLTAVLGLILLAACARLPEAPRLDLEHSSFGALKGWQNDDQDEALSAFQRSCGAFAALPDDRSVGPVGGTVADWRPACEAAAGIGRGAARAFFEAWFTPFRASNRGASEGLFTGYYEPLLRGARQSGGGFTVPLHGRPSGLVTVDLGRFADDLEGRKIIGRVVDGMVAPLPDRGEIAAGALDGDAPVIAWVDDPVDAFFLHVQGSGRVALADGGMLRVGYGANGHAYTSIGKVLIERGEIARADVSLQSIRAWLASNPDQAADLLAANRSYVFFRELKGDGPLGAQEVALTPGRSLAIDRRFLSLGVPVWLDITAPGTSPGDADRPVRRLVIAQDTGGAIRGPVRGDVFWGFGPEAEFVAGHMKHRGGYYLLLPHTVAQRLP
jgi:membrane-bound lytic murein transglycosylase A